MVNYWLLKQLFISIALYLKPRAISWHVPFREVTHWRLGQLILVLVFFPNLVFEWNKLDINISSTSFLGFKNIILEEVKLWPSSVFGVHNLLGLKFLTRLKKTFSRFRENKFKHGFQDTLNLFCNSTWYRDKGLLFIAIDHNILKLDEKLLIDDTLLFGNPNVAFWLTLKHELLFYVYNRPCSYGRSWEARKPFW